MMFSTHGGVTVSRLAVRAAYEGDCFETSIMEMTCSLLESEICLPAEYSMGKSRLRVITENLR